MTPLHKIKIFFLCILLFSIVSLYAQPKGDFDRKKETTYDGKRYRVFNNYLTAGGGTCYNSYIQNTNLNIGIDFNYHIRQVYFQTGIFLAGPQFGNYSHLQLHTAVGKRFELNTFNMAGYLGPSMSFINRPLIDSVNNQIRSRTLQPFGFHAAVQFTFKFKYDVGIGVSLYSDINKEQSVYGLRLELYFSGAFLGDKKRKDMDNSALPLSD